MSAPSTDAIANISVTVAGMKNVFRIKRISGDIHNAGSNIRYYVDPASWPSINLTNSSTVTTGKLPISGRSTSTTAQDFIAYLSKKLLGPNDLVDLFNNESAIQTNMINLGISAQASVVAFLTNIGINGTNPLLSASDGTGKYMNNSDTSSNNIGRVIFNLIDDNDGARFTNALFPMNAVRSMPFISGDAIQLVLTVGAVATQNNLTSVASIASRTYLIQLQMS